MILIHTRRQTAELRIAKGLRARLQDLPVLDEKTTHRGEGTHLQSTGMKITQWSGALPIAAVA